MLLLGQSPSSHVGKKYSNICLVFDTQKSRTKYFRQICSEIFSFNYEKIDTLPPNNYSFDSMLTLLGQKWNSLVGFSLV